MKFWAQAGSALFLLVVIGCKEKSPAERYPGPWENDLGSDITRTLMAHGTEGCGDFYYREAYDNADQRRLSHRYEYLVACYDGTHKSLYVVFTVPDEAGQVIGPSMMPAGITWPDFEKTAP